MGRVVAIGPFQRARSKVKGGQAGGAANMAPERYGRSGCRHSV